MSDSRPQGVVPAHGQGGHRADVIDTGGLGRFAIWLVVSLVVIHVGLVALFGVYKLREDQADEAPLPLAAERALREHQGPPLRTDEVKQYRAMVEAFTQQQKILAANPRVDPQTGVGQIPIEHAMKLVVQGRRAEAPATQPAVSGGNNLGGGGTR